MTNTSNTTKAKIYLDANDDVFTVSNSGATIYGNTGNDVVTIAAAVSNVTLDQSIERINFVGASDSYTFKQTGNKINVYDQAGTTLLASAPVQGDADGTLLSFSDGDASGKLVSGGVMTLGLATVSSTATTLSIFGNTNISVSGTGTGSAASGNVIFTIAAGNYTYTINGFGTGDKLKFPVGNYASIGNSSFTDGIVELTYAWAGQVTTIHLTGLTAAQDGAIFDVDSFNTLFGAGSLTPTGVQTTSALTYSTTTFTEATANNGTIATTSTLTLTGDSFTGIAGSSLNVNATNLPVGLTASLIEVDATHATLSLTGTAAAHAAANSIINLGITLPVADFAKGAVPTGATAILAVNFIDPVPVVPGSLAYSTTTFTEATANNGTIATTSTLTLTGDSFTGIAGSSLNVNATNLPVGLTASLIEVDATHATLSLTGTAAAHAAANSVTNLGITLPVADFAKGVVATGATAVLAVNFIDPVPVVPGSLAYSTTTFTEATANNGTIATTSTLTLTGDSFTGIAGSSLNVNATNLPAGLTASLTEVDATHAMLSFTGTAAAHAAANSVTNLGITLPVADFAKGVVPTGATAVLAVNFIDPVPVVPGSLAYSTTTFTEATANNGTIATTSTLTLTGDSFTGVAGSQLNVNATNLPAGLTASLVQVDATHAMLSLTGTATAHAAANSVTNLSLALPAADFTKGVVATGATASNLAVTFIDPFVINNIVYATNANDTITGGNGIDTVSYGNAPSAVTVNLAGLYDSKGSSLGYNTSGGSGHDVLTNLNNIIGSQYDDTITGNSANNVLSGGDGNDTLYGGDGNDTFYGGKGNDSLYGSKGADTFSYGASNGQGGSSNDGVDTIYGFSPSEDKIAIVSGTNGITTPALAFAHLSTNAAGAAVLDLGASNTVTLAGISVATLSSSIFIVGSESAVNITAAGSSSAATGNITFNITFNITAGNYIYNISDFAAGDKLIFPQGPTPTVENTSFTDGSVDVIYAGSSGAATIHLTGLPAVQDGAILGITSFNSVFGSGALQQLAL